MIGLYVMGTPACGRCLVVLMDCQFNSMLIAVDILVTNTSVMGYKDVVLPHISVNSVHKPRIILK